MKQLGEIKRYSKIPWSWISSNITHPKSAVQHGNKIWSSPSKIEQSFQDGNKNDSFINLVCTILERLFIYKNNQMVYIPDIIPSGYD